MVDGRLLAGEFPRARMNLDSEAKLRQFERAGVTSFIDLTEEDELSSYVQWLNPKTQTHRRIPIRDQSVPNSEEEMTRILDTIDAELEAGETIYVHCFGGIGRTGTVIGCWLARHPGIAGEGSALERLGELFAQSSKSVYARSPETPEQVEFVRRWDRRCNGD